MPDLTRSIILYGGPQQTTSIDYSDPADTDWTRTELHNAAYNGDSSASTWVVRDEGGRIPDYRANLNKFLSAHNYTVATVGSNTIWRGRIDAKDISRQGQTVGRAHEFSITASDANSHLAGIDVFNWERPAETDAARVQALVAGYLSGSPRVTTNLNGSNYVITGSNTHNLKAKTYSAESPADILARMAENFDKEMFVDVDNNLHYHGHDYSGFDSTIRISDDLADLDANTCMTIDPHGSDEAREQITSVRVYYGEDTTDKAVVVNDTPSRTTDFWQTQYFDDQAKTAAEATVTGEAILADGRQDQVTYTVTIGKPGADQLGRGQPMTGDDIFRVKAGQRVQFKSRAVKSGINAAGTYTGDSFLQTRIREIAWTFPTPDAYWATLTLERPMRAHPRGTGAGRPSATVPDPPSSGNEIDFVSVAVEEGDSQDQPVNITVNQTQLYMLSFLANVAAPAASALWRRGNVGSSTEEMALIRRVDDEPTSHHDIEVWDLYDPDLSIHANAAVIHETADSRFAYAVLLYQGPTAADHAAEATGSGTAPSITTATVAGDVVVAGLSYHDHGPSEASTVITNASGQTERGAIVSGGTHSQGISVAEKVATTTSTTLSWTLGTSRPYSIVAVVLPGVGDVTQAGGNTGGGSTGTSGTYSPLDHVHAHGLLSEAGTHHHDLSEIEAFDHGELPGLADDDHPQYVRVRDGGKEQISVIAATGSTETVDLASGNVHDLTLTANCTITLTAVTSGVACSATLLLRQDGTGSRLVTWPGSVVWPGGVAPTLTVTAAAVDIITLLTLNGGTTWYGNYR